MLDGTLTERKAAGPRGQSVTYWALELRKPICVTAKPGDEIAVAKSGVARIHIALPFDEYPHHRHLLERHVRVKGTLLHAHTWYHHEVLVLKTTEFTANDEASR
jgi:hypothetical protein